MLCVLRLLEAAIGIEPMNKGFAVLSRPLAPKSLQAAQVAKNELKLNSV
jgi:hypothetical protein